MEKPQQPPNSTPKKEKQSQLNSYVRYSGLAFQMLGAIGLAAWGGIALDRYFELKFPVFLVVLTLMAVVAGIVLTIKSLPKD